MPRIRAPIIPCTQRIRAQTRATSRHPATFYIIRSTGTGICSWKAWVAGSAVISALAAGDADSVGAAPVGAGAVDGGVGGGGGEEEAEGEGEGEFHFYLYFWRLWMLCIGLDVVLVAGCWMLMCGGVDGYIS